jgi:cysteine synthase A
MKGAVDHALELERSIPNGKVLQQFENIDNARIHRETTALEIWNDTEGKVDIFVAAVGTGGTLTGTTQLLKEKNPALISIAVEPDASPVLSGGNAAPHRIQGIGAGFVPKVLDVSVFDEVLRVTNDEAFEMSRTLALTEGLLVGISAGANVHAARKVASRAENKGKMIVTVLCDTGERYLSTDLFGEG